MSPKIQIIAGAVVALGISSSVLAGEEKTSTVDSVFAACLGKKNKDWSDCTDNAFKQCVNVGHSWSSCAKVKPGGKPTKFFLSTKAYPGLQEQLKIYGTAGGGFGHPSAAQSFQRNYFSRR